MNQKKLVIGTIIGFIVLVGLIIFLNQMKNKDNFGQEVTHPSIEGQPTIGNEDATVSIVEFGDYKCPACMSWADQIYPKLVKDYIDTGKVKLSFVNVLIYPPESTIASLASEYVNLHHPDQFWDVHQAIFHAQKDSTTITLESITEIVQTVIPELDVDQFQAGLQEEGDIADALQTDLDLGNQTNITKTPSVVINGILLDDPFDYKMIQKAIEHKLED